MIRPVAWRIPNTRYRWWLDTPDDAWEYSSIVFHEPNQEALFNVNPNDYIMLLELALESLINDDRKLQRAIITDIQNILNKSGI